MSDPLILSEVTMSAVGLEAYEIVRLIDSGGMGKVYEAVHRTLGRRVALKTIRDDLELDPSIQRRFVREAENLASLEHQNVVRLYEMFEHGGTRFLALEYVDGGDLDAALRAHPGGWPLEFALELLGGIAAGLAEAHRMGLVHRDIKPSNILITRRGCPKITDLGLARRERAETQVTQHGMVVGTLGYMSPEQWSGRIAGPASDVFSFGLLAFRVITGRMPFRDAGARSLQTPDFETHSLAQVAPWAPPELVSCIDAMLALDPRDRPKCADVTDTFEWILMKQEPRARTHADRERELAEFLAGHAPFDPILAERSTVMLPTGRPSKRRPAILLALIVVAVTAAGWWSVREILPDRQGPATDPPTAWLQLRFLRPTTVHSSTGDMLAESVRNVVLPFAPGTTGGLAASDDTFERASLPTFELVSGDTVVSPLLPLWSFVTFHSVPESAFVVIDGGPDEGHVEKTFILTAGQRPVRVRSPRGALQRVEVADAAHTFEVPFEATGREFEYEFSIDVPNGSERTVSMVFAPTRLGH